MKLTIIGGGSYFTPLLLKGLEKYQEDLHFDRIALLDINANAVEKIGLFCQNLLNERLVYKTEIIATTDQNLAIEGSDFVIFTIRVGGLSARVQDEKIPLKYGVFGDETIGPGGFSNSLRTIPVMLKYAEKIEQLAPHAWVIPFSNPEGILTEALTRNSKVKAIGLCTAPYAFQKELAKYLNVEFSRLRLDFFGLNHVGWVRNIFLDDTNILPQFLEKAEEMKGKKNLYPYQLIKCLDCIPAHWFFNLSGYEYPHWYYHKDQIFKNQIQAGKTRGEVLLSQMKEFAESDFAHVNIEDLEKKRGHHVLDEPILSLINSLQNGTDEIHIVDIPNKGSIDGFSPEMVIEMPALVGANGAVPLPIRALSPEVRGLMQLIKAYEELTIEAAVKGSYELALRALLANPLSMSFEIVQPLLDDILAANKNLLPDYWKL